MKLLKFIAISTVIWSLSLVFATESPPPPFQTPLVQEGKMFVVKLVPFEKDLKFILVGKEVVDIDWKSTELRVTLDLGKNLKRRLKITKEKDAFKIDEKLPTDQKYRMEVQTFHKGVAETYNFNIEQKPKP